jgi:hypothetical protein
MAGKKLDVDDKGAKYRLGYGAPDYTPPSASKLGAMGGGASASVGKVGSAMRNLDPRGPSTGAGYGATLNIPYTKKKGGTIKKMAAGGSASKRADGCATKGKTKGRFV